MKGSGKRKKGSVNYTNKCKKVVRSTSSDSIVFTQCSSMRDEDDDDLSQSQSQSQLSGSICATCKLFASNDPHEVTSLKCCLCDQFFHGMCLGLEDHLLQNLFVVQEIGSWCCNGCKKGKRIPKKPQARMDKFQSSFDSIKSELKIINDKIDIISNKSTVGCGTNVENLLFELVTSLQSRNLTSNGRSLTVGDVVVVSDGDSGEPSYPAIDLSDTSSHGVPWSSTAKTVNPLRLGREFRASVLSAVHSEFNTIDRRSSSIVITGLHPKNDVTDAEQFANLCLEHFKVNPSVRTTARLGTRSTNKPLLVNLSSLKDAEHLIWNARSLRNSKNEYVRKNVFINHHLTQAEAKSAYELRMKKISAYSTSNRDQPKATAQPPIQIFVPSVRSKDVTASVAMVIQNSAASGNVASTSFNPAPALPFSPTDKGSSTSSK